MLTARLPLKSYSNAEIKKFWFTQSKTDSKKWACEACKSSSSIAGKKWEFICQPGAGGTNLVNHVKNIHPNYIEVMFQAQNSDGTTKTRNEQLETISAFGTNPDAKSMFGWMELIVHKNLPLSICEDELFRKYLDLKPFSTKTVWKYLSKTCEEVVEVIKQKLPEKFGIIFDGWNDGSGCHYIAIFATFDGEKILLAFQPLLDKMNQTAQNRCNFIRTTL